MTDVKATQKLSIRAAIPEDEAGIARVCLKTADHGADASELYSRPDLLGLIWATPYLVHSPANCFVVENRAEIVGYIMTTPDTCEFESWQSKHWWPEVERRLAGFCPKTARDQDALDTIRALHHQTPEYVARYPAHLHINLMPEVQGTGFGRKLMDTACEKLRLDGVSGIHLGVSFKNTNAIGFYKATGFVEIARTGALIMGKLL